METRLEKYRQRRKNMYFNIFKLIVLISMLGILSILVINVNNTIIELDCLDNTQLFSFNIEAKSLSFLGETYYININ